MNEALIVMTVPKNNNIKLLKKEVVIRPIYFNDGKNVNYKTFSMPNIELEHAKSYINEMLMYNKNVTIYSIYYHKDIKTLIFYTNKELNTEFLKQFNPKDEFSIDKLSEIENYPTFVQDIKIKEEESIYIVSKYTKSKTEEEYINLLDFLAYMVSRREKESLLKHTISNLKYYLVGKTYNHKKISEFKIDYSELLMSRTEHEPIIYFNVVFNNREREQYQAQFESSYISSSFFDHISLNFFDQMWQKSFIEDVINDELMVAKTIIDEIKPFIKFKSSKIPIANYSGQLEITKEFIKIYNKDIFKIECKIEDSSNKQMNNWKENIEVSSPQYKEYLGLEKNSLEILKNTYVEIDLLPEFIKTDLKNISKEKNQKKLSKKK